MVVDNAIRQAIHENQDEFSIENIHRIKARSLRENGLLKAISGETTLEEVIRVTAEQEITTGNAV